MLQILSTSAGEEWPSGSQISAALEKMVENLGVSVIGQKLHFLKFR